MIVFEEEFVFLNLFVILNGRRNIELDKNGSQQIRGKNWEENLMFFIC